MNITLENTSTTLLVLQYSLGTSHPRLNTGRYYITARLLPTLISETNFVLIFGVSSGKEDFILDLLHFKPINVPGGADIAGQ